VSHETQSQTLQPSGPLDFRYKQISVFPNKVTNL